MKPTLHYRENSERASAWIIANAPDYVRECTEELGHHVILATRAAQEWQAVAEALQRENEELQLDLSDAYSFERDELRWYHWFFPPYAVMVWFRSKYETST